ncbi:hypothetical protein O3M35_010155 [Rhynocoris fuscipes]|uniref:Uncharacterized protein n=1 Tax=Rhynocoris fuscipes TaxID=488301 RepID=A0AAW1D1H0_9HEMI
MCSSQAKQRNELFGASLILANSPMSPKIVNGSFAAIFYPESEDDWTKGWSFLTNLHRGSPARRKMMGKKQFSLDSRLDLVQYCIGIKDATAALPACAEFNQALEVSPTDRESVESECSSTETEIQTRPNRSKSLGESLQEDEEVENHPTSSTNYSQRVCLKCGHLEPSK